MAELSGCNRDWMVDSAPNIYYLALYRQNLLTPVLDHKLLPASVAEYLLFCTVITFTEEE